MEASNVKAMREALEFVAHMYDSPYTTYDVLVAVQKARTTLSEPPRNCDVGSAEEQAERFGKLCIKYYNEDGHCNRKCPLASLDFIHGFPRCQAYWTQMPYEEGGAS